MRTIQGSVAVVGLAIAAASASAQTSVLSFDDLATGTYNSNIVYQGYVLSPRYWFQVLGPNSLPPQPSNWLGITASASLSPANPGYLGPADGPLLWITRQDGLPFSLVALTSVGVISSASSSSGGSQSFMQSGGWSFGGPQWSGLSWLGFAATSGEPKGFDNLVLTAVPEPGSIALLLAGIAALGIHRRRSLGPWVKTFATA